METPKQRIKMILKYKSINAKQLSEVCGCQRAQVIYDVLNEKTKSVSQSLSIKIVSAFPEISKTWLLTGEGEMIEQFDNSKEPRNESQDELITALQRHIIDLQSERDRLLEERSELKSEIERLRSLLDITPREKETA